MRFRKKSEFFLTFLYFYGNGASALSFATNYVEILLARLRSFRRPQGGVNLPKRSPLYIRPRGYLQRASAFRDDGILPIRIKTFPCNLHGNVRYYSYSLDSLGSSAALSSATGSASAESPSAVSCVSAPSSTGNSSGTTSPSSSSPSAAFSASVSGSAFSA